MTEAALRARIAELEAALHQIARSGDYGTLTSPDGDRHADAILMARAALYRPEPPTPPPHLRETREVWTPERLSLLVSMAPTKPPEVVLACLNDLPGVPIASVEAVRLRYGLERSRGAA